MTDNLKEKDPITFTDEERVREALKEVKAMLVCQFCADGSTKGIHGLYMRTLIEVCDEGLGVTQNTMRLNITSIKDTVAKAERDIDDPRCAGSYDHEYQDFLTKVSIVCAVIICVILYFAVLS